MAQVVPPIVETPFGKLILGFEINDDLITVRPARAYESPNAGALRWQWTSDFGEAQLAICSIKPNIPDGMHITDCTAALWRIKIAKRRVEKWVVSCRLDALNPGQPGSSCSGQGLDALEWSNGDISMTLGTQNMYAMLGYRNNGGLLPERWIKEWNRDPEMFSFVEYAPNGFILKPPPLEPNEQVQFQFIVVWANEPGGDIGPWYAVDMPPAQILAALI